VADDDDDSVRARMAALEAEVKADANATRARKEAALAKVRAERAAQQAEQQALRERQVALTTTKPAAKATRPRDDARDARDDGDDLGGALELARKAHGVRQELARKPGQGEKSWMISGAASMLLGPLGWLYAGSLREAVPASAAWLAFGYVASKLIPMFLLMPVLMVALPLSGIAGVVYAVQHNRRGKRQRLFDKEPAKKLPPGR
jgi:uncharacterized membrane protein YdbT with pleckstrin-like domain